MLFNSFHFLVFFPIVVCLYFALPPRFRWILLLAASYYFYASWHIGYLGLLIFSTLVDYVTGILLERTQDRRARKRILSLSLMSNLGMLGIFKYLGFLTNSAAAVLGKFGVFSYLPELSLLLPVGISFYTFQSLSYTIGVYRGDLPAERHLGIFAVYVSFFPQLVAGPIERPSNLLPQFRRVHHLDAGRIRSGLELMLWGFVKKVCIADRVSGYVNTVYNAPAAHDGLALLLATYGFAVQIYCDFSGYTDIARGAARVMGYELRLNFRQPYLSQSIREFWGRWHISLSTWFRDFVYVPLGGSRVSKVKWYRNLFITFLVSGLWHGASWTFVIWGALHGVYVVLGHMTQSLRARLLPSSDGPLQTVWRVACTFHLVVFAWIFFRANTVEDAFFICGRVLALPVDLVRAVLGDAALTLRAPFNEPRDLIFIAAVVAVMSLSCIERFRTALLGAPFGRTAALSVLFWFLVIFGTFDNQQFIYFQF